MNILLNLNEGKFPIKINDSYNLSFIEEVHVIDLVIVDINIEKPSQGVIYAKGTIDLSYVSECSSCSKNITNTVNIKTHIEIQDISMSLNKRYINKDVHFQDLTQFEIKDLIKEEIYLNIPNIIFCEDNSCNKEILDKNDDLIQPFKKIRDLIK